MATGTYDRIGAGTSEDPFRPDLSSLETATVKPRFKRLLSEDKLAGTMTCEYELVTKTTAERNGEKLRSVTLKTVVEALEAGTATSAQVQKALAWLIREKRGEAIK